MGIRTNQKIKLDTVQYKQNTTRLKSGPANVE
jgi:hypothetical protein